MTMTNRLLLAIAILSLATIPLLARPVAADNNTGTLGQPNQSCQSVLPSGPLSPAGFNTQGFANAATHYEDSGQTLQNQANSAAVPPYDVDSFQVAHT